MEARCSLSICMFGCVSVLLFWQVLHSYGQFVLVQSTWMSLKDRLIGLDGSKFYFVYLSVLKCLCLFLFLSSVMLLWTDFPCFSQNFFQIITILAYVNVLKRPINWARWKQDVWLSACLSLSSVICQLFYSYELFVLVQSM